MPFRPPRLCKHPSCSEPAPEGPYCPRHAINKRVTRPYDNWRGSSHSRGYGADWRKVRLKALERDKHLCQDCLARKRYVRATEVHHEVPIVVDESLRLDLNNLRSLCKECHSSITATRDSTFAHRENP